MMQAAGGGGRRGEAGGPKSQVLCNPAERGTGVSSADLSDVASETEAAARHKLAQ